MREIPLSFSYVTALHVLGIRIKCIQMKLSGETNESVQSILKFITMCEMDGSAHAKIISKSIITEAQSSGNEH